MQWKRGSMDMGSIHASMQIQLMGSLRYDWQVMFNQSKWYLARMYEKSPVKKKSQDICRVDLPPRPPTPVPKPNSFNIHNMKESGCMHFLTHICYARMNLCQIHFGGGILRFDLGHSCSDSGRVSLMQLWAILPHLADTKPTWMLPVMRLSSFFYFFVRPSHFTHRSYLKMSAIQIMARHLFEIQVFNRLRGLRVKTELICVASSRMQD